MARLPSSARILLSLLALWGLLLPSAAPFADEPVRPPFVGVRGIVVEDLGTQGGADLSSRERAAKVRLTKTRFPSGKDRVAVDLYEPADAGVHPTLVVLHGTHGPRRGEAYYLAMSEDLARHGYVTLFVRYYDRGRKNRSRGNRPQWDDTIGHALDWAVTLPSVDPDRLGLVGYSQGAFLSLNYAPTDPRVKAIAAFYGGLSPGFFPAAREHMPPTLILHGTADRIVPVRRALETFEWLRDSGKAVDLVIYPTVGHGFTLHERGGWDEVAGADAWERTLNFLDYQLKAQGWRPESPGTWVPATAASTPVGPTLPAVPPTDLPPLRFALGLTEPISPEEGHNPLAQPPLTTVPYLGAPRSDKGKDFVLVNPEPSVVRALAAKNPPTKKRSSGKGKGVRKPTAAAAPKGGAAKSPATRPAASKAGKSAPRSTKPPAPKAGAAAAKPATPAKPAPPKRP